MHGGQCIYLRSMHERHQVSMTNESYVATYVYQKQGLGGQREGNCLSEAQNAPIFLAQYQGEQPTCLSLGRAQPS